MRHHKITFPDLALALVLLGLFSSSCKSPAAPEQPAPKPIVKVTLEFDVYNHTQGYLTHFTRADVTAGTQITISVSDITGISGVDQTHIIIREDSLSGELGKRVAWDKSSGSATFTVPSESGDYDIFLLNGASSGQYGKIDEWVDTGEGILRFPRDCTYHRQDRDGRTGPEEPITNAIGQLIDELGLPNVPHITRRAAAGMSLRHKIHHKARVTADVRQR